MHESDILQASRLIFPFSKRLVSRVDSAGDYSWSDRCVITSGSSKTCRARITRGSAIKKMCANGPRINHNEHISSLFAIINTIDTCEAAALLL